MSRAKNVIATRLNDREVVVRGITHCGTVPSPGGEQFVGWASADHRWVVVRTAGLWVLGQSGTEYQTFPDSVRFHRMHRSEAAAHAEASSLPGGAVIEIDRAEAASAKNAEKPNA